MLANRLLSPLAYSKGYLHRRMFSVPTGRDGRLRPKEQFLTAVERLLTVSCTETYRIFLFLSHLDLPGILSGGVPGRLVYVGVQPPSQLHALLLQRRHTLEWRKKERPHKLSWDVAEAAGYEGRVELLAEPTKDGRPIILYRIRSFPSPRLPSALS